MHDPFVQAVRTHRVYYSRMASYAIDYGLVDRKGKALRIVRCRMVVWQAYGRP